jgi:predicted nucleic acid-binding protein
VKVFADSSAFAKRYVEENGSETVSQVLEEASQLGLSILLVPEIISGLNRRIRENSLSSKDYGVVKQQLLDDVKDAVIIQLTPGVISSSVKLLEDSALRAMDALHLACALEWRADLFLTSDRRQYRAAVAEGLKTEAVGVL